MVSHKSASLCPICSEYTHEFKRDKITEELVIQYQICQSCGLIHSFDHAFFETILYRDNYFDDIDSGWKNRSDQMFSILDKFFSNKKPLVILDIGAGTNYLVHRLEQAGYDAYGLDAHSEALYAKDRFFRDFKSLPTSKFDLIVLFEVMEHLVHPMEEIKQFLEFLKPSGQIMFSTVLYNPNRHKSVDWYVNPRFGHVTIWSINALHHIFDELEFRQATMYRLGNIQIWSRLPGPLINRWTVQKNFGYIRSYLGHLRYLLRRKMK